MHLQFICMGYLSYILLTLLNPHSSKDTWKTSEMRNYCTLPLLLLLLTLAHEFAAALKYPSSGAIQFKDNENEFITRPAHTSSFLLGSNLLIECPKPDRIKILYASLPSAVPDNLQSIVTDTVSTKCNNQQSCTLSNYISLLPFVTIPPSEEAPSLQVTYICQGSKSKKAINSLQSVSPSQSLSTPTILSLGDNKGWIVTDNSSLNKKTSDFNRDIVSTKHIYGLSSILEERMSSLSKEFLSLPGIGCNCLKPLNFQVATINEAKYKCLNELACSFIIMDQNNSTLPFTLCTDSSLTLPKHRFEDTVFVKGKKVLEGIPSPFNYSIYLNLQGICEDDSLIEEHDGVNSVSSAAKLCSFSNNCDYFIMTTEVGLVVSTNTGTVGSYPNHLWLCTTSASSQVTEDKEKKIEETQQFPGLSAVAVDGVISGYHHLIIQKLHPPIVLAL